MNYYPFHIGDYLSATRHLSWEEDAAFRRLLDTYYTTEKPLPVELRAACRLVLATTESQREAVQIVLDEFFVLTPAGWVNNRADAEIDAMRDKQVMSETRDLHEKERMRRHRERRAEMFAALREVNVVPAWDIAMKELQRLHDLHCNEPPAAPATPESPPETEPKTHLQREQVISSYPPATAISTNTNTNTNTIKEEGETRKRATTPVRPDDVDEQVWTDWVQLRKAKKATVSPTVIAEARIEAGKAGMSLDRFLAVWCARGSQGLMADWLKPDERRMPTAPPESFAERDARNKREKWERETGKQWPVDELPTGARPARPLAIVIDENNTRRIS